MLGVIDVVVHLSGLVMKCYDVDQPGALGSVFRFYDKSPSFREMAYLFVVDVSEDESEPFVGGDLFQVYRELDRHLEREIRCLMPSLDLEFVAWTKSVPSEYLGKKVLASGYRVAEQTTGRSLRQALRFSHLGRKFALEVSCATCLPDTLKAEAMKMIYPKQFLTFN